MYEEMPNIVMPVGKVTPSGVSLLGTCFLTNKPGWFATASHIIQGSDSSLVIIIPESDHISNYQDTTTNQVKLINAKVEKIDPVHDTAIISIPTSVTSSIDILGLDNTLVGTEIDLFGFPHANFGRKVLTKQAADIGAKILLDNSGVRVKHAVINMQTRPGQSGSPVFIKNTNKIVAILVGSYAPGNSSIRLGDIDPQTLHMTSHAVSSEYILRMI